MSRNTSIILIAHNQKDLIVNQIALLKIFNNIDKSSIIIVDNYSSDGLKEYLWNQNEIDYIICDEQLENYSTILNTCISEFTHDNDILIIDSVSVLLPGCIDSLCNRLNPELGIYAVTPDCIFYGHNNITTIEEAISYSEHITHNSELSKAMKPYNTTVLISHELLSSCNPFDEHISSSNICYSDFFMNNIIHDRFLYTVNNAYQYIIEKRNNYYEKILGIDYDMPYIRKKWNMNYMNMFPNPNLVANIKEPVNEKLNILEIGCDCGATLLGIQKVYPDAYIYGIEINPVSANIASHIAHIKSANIEESVDVWDNVKFDYIIFGDVLEHLHNPSDVINRCRHILKDHGKIISSIPNLMHYSVLYQLINGNFTYTDTGLLDKTHIHFFTYNEIVRLYEENGYKILSMNASMNVNESNKNVTDFIDSLCDLSNHKNKQLFEAFQYITLAEKISD